MQKVSVAKSKIQEVWDINKDIFVENLPSEEVKNLPR
jgi:hypothetical protein